MVLWVYMMKCFIGLRFETSAPSLKIHLHGGLEVVGIQQMV